MVKIGSKKLNLTHELLLNLLKEGKRPSVISKELNVSKQLISYYIKGLKAKGLVKKVAYGVWKTSKIPLKDTRSYLRQVKEVRGHAFVWKLKLDKKRNWKELLLLRGIPFGLVGFGTPRIIVNDKKVWLGGKNVIVFDSSSYFGNNAVESRKFAVIRFLRVLDALEERLGVSLKGRFGYVFKPSKSHYSLVKNDLAIQCNEQGIKIRVSYYGETWFLIDNSFNLDEAETVSPKDSLIDNVGIQRYFNSHKATGFKVTPEFVLEVMGGIQANQLVFDKNMASHLEVLDKIGKAVEELRNEIKKLGSKDEM